MFIPIKVQITEKMKADATARDCGQMNGKSFRKGKGNYVGFLGEYAFWVLRPDAIHANVWDYDFTLEGVDIDVKTKEQTALEMTHGDWESSVADVSQQQTDIYVFCRVIKALSVCWILGWKSKEDYLIQSRHLQEGREDGDNGYIVKAGCRNMMNRDLNPISELFKEG